MTIVQDDKMAGEPRLEGRRITVLTVVTFIEDFGSINEAAEELRIPEEEVRDALEWARGHPEEMEKVRDEWDDLIDRMPDLGQEPLPEQDR